MLKISTATQSHQPEVFNLKPTPDPQSLHTHKEKKRTHRSAFGTKFNNNTTVLDGSYHIVIESEDHESNVDSDDF